MPNWVRLQARPGVVQAAGALVLGADAVRPAVAGDEVSARIARDRHAEFADQPEHVGPEPVRVGGRVVRLIDSSVNGAPEVFDETAVDAFVDFADGEVAVQNHAGFHNVVPCFCRNSELW